MSGILVSTAAEKISPNSARTHYEPASARAEGEAIRQPPAPLRLLQQKSDAAEDHAARLALPTMATAGDVRELVQYLKKKSAGVSVMEAIEDVRRRVFEPRKIVAYELWGLVTRRHDRLLLTPLGREFARRLEPEARAYRALLRRTECYAAALEWMRRQHADTITHTEVVAFWRQLFTDVAPRARLEANEGHVVCFFHLCQAAQFGAATIGKRGQPARLRIDREELASYFAEEDAPLETPSSAPEELAPFAPSLGPERVEDETRASACESLRVFVSARRKGALAAQVETTLALAGNICEVFTRDAGDALLPSTEEAHLMRACEAAVFIVSEEDYRRADDLTGVVSQNLLVQIAASVVLYEGRVALLWESGLAAPPSLEGLRCFSIAGDVLTWEVGIGLLKAARDFQKEMHRAA